jgi:aryl-alcohol dehydrogenase-like predicted oxidoreductase
MNFGPETSEDDSHAIMDRAVEHGINFLDTANVYGWRKGEGVTEQIVGRWIAKGGGRREKLVLATKVYSAMGDWPNESRLSALHIRRACDESLRRLQTDHIDLYQMHHVDRAAPWEEIWQAMEVLVQQGKVLYVGSSNFAGWHIARANEAARHRNFLGLVSEQCLYNLNDRMAELEVLPACEGYGMGVIPYSPLAGGLLGGVLKKISEGRRASADCRRRSKRSARRSTATRSSAPTSASSPQTWRSPGCSRTPLSHPRSSALAPRSSWTPRFGPWISRWTWRSCEGWTICSPGPAAPGRRRTPGDGHAAGSTGRPMRYRRSSMAAQDTPAEFEPLTQEEQAVILEVVRLLRRLRYGTVLLVVQDGKVVQIEMAEKIRLR